MTRTLKRFEIQIVFVFFHSKHILYRCVIEKQPILSMVPKALLIKCCTITLIYLSWPLSHYVRPVQHPFPFRPIISSLHSQSSHVPIPYLILTVYPTLLRTPSFLSNIIPLITKTTTLVFFCFM